MAQHPAIGRVMAVGVVRPHWMFVTRVTIGPDGRTPVYWGLLWSEGKNRWTKTEHGQARRAAGQPYPETPRPPRPGREGAVG